jgi:hypothetical protein
VLARVEDGAEVLVLERRALDVFDPSKHRPYLTSSVPIATLPAHITSRRTYNAGRLTREPPHKRHAWTLTDPDRRETVASLRSRGRSEAPTLNDPRHSIDHGLVRRGTSLTSGKVAVVTGANGGFGLEVSRELARKCAFVVMASRDQDKAEETRGRSWACARYTCPPTISSARWHATVRSSTRRGFGTSARHRPIAYGHLGWNGHPGGGFAGSGTVPGSTILDRRAGGERPHVVVTIDLESLLERSGRRSEFPDTGWITPETARSLACDADLSRVITRGASEPLELGRRTKVVPPGLRRAIAVRDRGCRFPGCGRPPGWCDAHHILHWADGGETSLGNLVLLCRPHHRAIHRGFGVEMIDGRPRSAGRTERCWRIAHRPRPDRARANRQNGWAVAATYVRSNAPRLHRPKARYSSQRIEAVSTSITTVVAEA